MNLNNLSHTEAKEHVASLFMSANALVVDLADASGYPDMMILVKDCMPLFVFVQPDTGEDADWKAAKRIVVHKLAEVNATWFDVSDTSDLDWVLGEVLHRTKPGEIVKTVQVDAEQAGFGPDVNTAPPAASDASAGTSAPETVSQPQRDRKAWLA